MPLPSFIFRARLACSCLCFSCSLPLSSFPSLLFSCLVTIRALRHANCRFYELPPERLVHVIWKPAPKFLMLGSAFEFLVGFSVMIGTQQDFKILEALYYLSVLSFKSLHSRNSEVFFTFPSHCFEGIITSIYLADTLVSLNG